MSTASLDETLTPGCRALGIHSPAHLSIALLTSRALSCTARSVVRAMHDARRLGDVAAAKRASDAAVAVADGLIEVAS